MQRAATAPEAQKSRRESTSSGTAGKTQDSINVLLATLSALGYDATGELPEHQQLAYSEQDAAGLLGISPRTLFTLRKEGKVRAVKIGKRVIYPREELQRFLTSSAE